MVRHSPFPRCFYTRFTNQTFWCVVFTTAAATIRDAAGIFRLSPNIHQSTPICSFFLWSRAPCPPLRSNERPPVRGAPRTGRRHPGGALLDTELAARVAGRQPHSLREASPGDPQRLPPATRQHNRRRQRFLVRPRTPGWPGYRRRWRGDDDAATALGPSALVSFGHSSVASAFVSPFVPRRPGD